MLFDWMRLMLMDAIIDCVVDETCRVKLCPRCGWLWAFCIHAEEPIEVGGSVAINAMLDKIMLEDDLRCL